MSNPQQPELARSRKTPAQDPDASAAVVEGQQQLGTDAPRGPVPPENQPGHRPEQEQDKPDLNAFADRLGIVNETEAERRAEDGASSTEAPPTAEGQPAGANRGPLVWAGAMATALTLLGLLLNRRRRRGRRRSRR